MILCIFDSIGNVFAITDFCLKKAFKLISWSTPVYVDIWPKGIYPAQSIVSVILQPFCWKRFRRRNLFVGEMLVSTTCGS